MKKLLIFMSVLLFMACATIPNRTPTYDTATLLFFSNDHRTIIGKFINVPKEVPADFTELSYNEVFKCSQIICEIRFAENKGASNFYSVFVLCNNSKVIALAKTQGINNSTLFWIYNNKDIPIEVSYTQFKETTGLSKVFGIYSII